MYHVIRPVRFSLYSLAIAIIIFCSLSATAQSKESKVLLRSGEKVKGTIITVIPDEYITIVTSENSNRKILASDIVEIDGELIKRHGTTHFSATVGVFAGYDLTSGQGYTVVNPNITVGLHIKHWRVGGGIGFLYAYSASYQQPTVQNDDISSLARQSFSYCPIFGNVHYEFGKKQILPSLDLSLGYPINTNKTQIYSTENIPNLGYYYYFTTMQGKFYGQFSPGVSFKVAKFISMNVAITFNLLVLKEFNQTNDQTNLGNDPTSTTNSDTRICGAVGGSVNFLF